MAFFAMLRRSDLLEKTRMNRNELSAVALAMVGNGKGILAADESTPTIGKRFAAINTESGHRRLHRWSHLV